MRRGDEDAAAASFQVLACTDAAEYGDLFLEVADLLLSVGRHAEALPLLQVTHDQSREPES